jgi:hypothetical protein
MRHVVTPVDINNINREYWSKRDKVIEQQLRDVELVNSAVALMRSEETRSIPVYSRFTFENALDQANVVKTSTLRHQALKGGLAAKGDPLNRFIEQVMSRRPDMSCNELLQRIRDQAPLFPIESVNDEEIVVRRDPTGIDVKSVPISGLKDRHSRARRKVRSS